MLVPIVKVPEGLKRVEKINGRTILAEGETTGHAHAICADVGLLASDLADLENRFLQIEKSVGKVDAWECKNHSGETVYLAGYQDKGAVEAAGLTVVGGIQLRGVVVEHEEHLHQVIVPGNYKVLRQREMQDEAPAYVAD